MGKRCTGKGHFREGRGDLLGKKSLVFGGLLKRKRPSTEKRGRSRKGKKGQILFYKGKNFSEGDQEKGEKRNARRAGVPGVKKKKKGPSKNRGKRFSAKERHRGAKEGTPYERKKVELRGGGGRSKKKSVNTKEGVKQNK